MKAIYSVFVTVVILSFASCSSSEDGLSMQNNLFDSMKNMYGIEMASLQIPEAGQAPSIMLDEVQGVLETLRKNNNVQQNCVIEQSDRPFFGGSNEISQKVVMSNSYQAITARGTFLENFQLRVELNFCIDSQQVYYVGTDYVYNSNLFVWRANGLSLAPAKNADRYTYEFESQSFLYFKVKDEGDCLIKLPVLFKGYYNFQSKKGTYSFQLLNSSK